jgi:hypothetical protein
MSRFYMVMDCETCGEEMFLGPVLTTMVHNTYPVLPWDIAATEDFECESCGGVSRTGDFTDSVEHVQGDVSEDDEEDGAA